MVFTDHWWILWIVKPKIHIIRTPKPMVAIHTIDASMQILLDFTLTRSKLLSIWTELVIVGDKLRNGRNHPRPFCLLFKIRERVQSSLPKKSNIFETNIYSYLYKYYFWFNSSHFCFFFSFASAQIQEPKHNCGSRVIVDQIRPKPVCRIRPKPIGLCLCRMKVRLSMNIGKHRIAGTCAEYKS